VLLLMARDRGRWLHWVAALGLAWLATGTILLTSTWIRNLVGQRALIACERLMGLLLTTIAVQMALTGIREFLTDLP
jgi:multiple antibiotic resistance protein